MKVVERCRKQFPNQTLEQVCRIAAKCSAPRFYVSVKHALTVYYRYHKYGSFHNNVSFINMKMYKELFRKYELLKDVSSFRTNDDIMRQTLLSPASSFFIEPKWAKHYYYRALKARKR